MAISDWPEDQRPRERLMTYGPQALSDQELLAVFLRTGVQGKNALDLGREILDYFGSLGKLFSASPDALDHFKGIGPAKIALMQAVMELARRTSSEELKRGPVLVSSHAVNRFLQSQFAGEQSESFIGLFLDVQHRLIACERMFQGTLTRTCVYPREVARLALAHNAVNLGQGLGFDRLNRGPKAQCDGQSTHRPTQGINANHRSRDAGSRHRLRYPILVISRERLMLNSVILTPPKRKPCVHAANC